MFFALDHGNYARWLPVHLHDMRTLYLTNPAIYKEFNERYFVVSKNVRKFSSIPIDHAHEQNNKIIKGDGGAVGLTENSAGLARWMISSPEVSRTVQEFESNLPFNKDVSSDTKYHKENKCFQDRFCRHVTFIVTSNS